jgi:ATP-dependent DNA helicase RecQ
LYELLSERHNVGLYHGKRPAADRKAVQDSFMSGETKAIIATNAFGLGIDKQDIRFVVHYHFPGSIESFYRKRDEPAATDCLQHVPCCIG